MKVEIYENSINPFDKETALRFVKNHENVFNDRTFRRVVYKSENLIVVKETNYFRDLKAVWYWGFSKKKRGVIPSPYSDGKRKVTIGEKLKTEEVVKVFLDRL